MVVKILAKYQRIPNYSQNAKIFQDFVIKNSRSLIHSSKISEFWCVGSTLRFSSALLIFLLGLENALKCRLCRQNRRRYSRHFSVFNL